MGGLPEATKPGFSSILVERKNEKQLADAIENLVNDDKLRRKMGKKARIFVEENYDINDNFGEVEYIYKRIINNFAHSRSI